MPTLPLRIGGVMRCCVETYDEYEGPEASGTILPCKFCDQSLIVKADAWGWNHPDDHPRRTDARQKEEEGRDETTGQEEA